MKTCLYRAIALVWTCVAIAQGWAQDTTHVVKHPPAFAGPAAMLAQVPRRPSVVDSTYAVAAAILARLKITVVSRDSADTTARPGTVLRQSPPARTVVRPGAVDTLYVVRPKTARFVPVPDVRGQPYAQAADRIRSVGLVPVGPALSLADSGRARVVVQSPTAPNRVPVGYRVTLRVSVDPRAIVPQLV